MKLEKLFLASKFDPSKIVSSHEIFSRKSVAMDMDGVVIEQKQFNPNSLFSRRIFGDMDSKEDYACECGHLHGKFYEGSICPKCQTEVVFIGLNINKYGWIDLSLSEYDENGTITKKGNGCHIIEYIPYYQLEKVIGRDNLRNIIHVRNTITLSGEIDERELKTLREETPESKYYYYGIEGFYNNYKEILDYYYQLRGKNEDFYKYLQNRDDVFTDKIPVISIILRPAMRTAEGLKLDDINIKYQNILKNMEILKEVNMIQLIRDATIEQIQAEFMLLSEEILEAVKSKSGIIRNQICGTRINFSARNIISPGKVGVKMDECVVPYLTFLELYKFEIINVIRITENVSLKQAEQTWFNATLEYDDKIYKIMKKMIQDNEIGVLLNRNPTIAYRINSLFKNQRCKTRL